MVRSSRGPIRVSRRGRGSDDGSHHDSRSLAFLPAGIPTGGRACHRPAGRRGRCRRERAERATEDTHARPSEGGPTGTTENDLDGPSGAERSEGERSGESAPTGQTCEIGVCGGREGLRVVEHPQRGRLVVCPFHARQVDELGGDDGGE